MRHDLVRALVVHFCDELGYDGPPLRIFTRRASWERHFRNRGGIPHGSAADDMGEMVRFKSHTAIFIDAERHLTLAQLVDTCAHEAAHAKRGRVHGPQFYPTVARLLSVEEIRQDARVARPAPRAVPATPPATPIVVAPEPPATAQP